MKLVILGKTFTRKAFAFFAETHERLFSEIFKNVKFAKVYSREISNIIEFKIFTQNAPNSAFSLATRQMCKMVEVLSLRVVSVSVELSKYYGD